MEIQKRTNSLEAPTGFSLQVLLGLATIKCDTCGAEKLLTFANQETVTKVTSGHVCPPKEPNGRPSGYAAWG